MLPQIIKRHTFTYKDLSEKLLQFSDFKSRIKVCHPREMDVVEAEMIDEMVYSMFVVTLPTCDISVREERDETWQVGVYQSAVHGWLGYIEY